MQSIWNRIPQPFLCLAPMEGVTDTVFRRVVNQAGRPDVSFTEFTSVDGLASHGFAYVAQRLKFEPDEQPLIAQIWGINPDNFFTAAQLLVKLKFSGIDINMGCPVKDVVKKGGGAGLIGHEERVKAILQATRKGAGKLPVSIKTRLGRREIETSTWMRFLLGLELDALIIHGRTIKEMSKRAAHWEEIGKVVNWRNDLKSPTVIVGNGDVLSRSEAMKMSDKYGVDGVMIGRGALKNPWVFSQSNKAGYTKQEKLELLRYHLNLFLSTWKEQKPFVVLRKYFKIYVQGFPGATRMREALMSAQSPVEVEHILRG